MSVRQEMRYDNNKKIINVGVLNEANSKSVFRRTCCALDRRVLLLLSTWKTPSNQNRKQKLTRLVCTNVVMTSRSPDDLARQTSDTKISLGEYYRQAIISKYELSPESSWTDSIVVKHLYRPNAARSSQKTLVWNKLPPEKLSSEDMDNTGKQSLESIPGQFLQPLRCRRRKISQKTCILLGFLSRPCTQMFDVKLSSVLTQRARLLSTYKFKIFQISFKITHSKSDPVENETRSTTNKDIPPFRFEIFLFVQLFRDLVSIGLRYYCFHYLTIVTEIFSVFDLFSVQRTQPPVNRYIHNTLRL